MSNETRLIDLERIPAEHRASLVHIAEQHNALVNDVQRFIGSTPEEQAESEKIMATARKIMHVIGKKWRLNVTILMVHVGIGSVILKNVFGVSPAIANRFVEAFLKILEKIIGAI